MIDFKSPHERYYQDPDFRALVDMMVSYIATCKYTPSEMREASLLACIKWESIKPPEITVRKEDLPPNVNLQDIKKYITRFEEIK